MKILNTSFFIALLGLVLFSCSKESTKTESSYNKTTEAIYEEVSFYKNPLNSMDEYGQMHNDQLDEFFAEKLPNSYTNEEVYDYFQVSDVYSAYLEQLFDEVPNNSYSGDILNFMQENPEITTYFNTINQIMIDENSGLIDKVNSIIDYENNFDYSTVDNDAANILKLSSSIARHSLYYWAPLSEGGLDRENYVKDILYPDPASSVNWDYWRKIAANDYLSACFGAFFTANPFIALGGGVAGSAISVFLDYNW